MSVLPDDFHVALEFQRQFGLLTNDSLNLAVARRLGLTALATANQGFANAVHGFMVYRPSDLVRPLNPAFSPSPTFVFSVDPREMKG